MRARGLSSAPRGFAARSRVLARLASLVQIGELARRLLIRLLFNLVGMTCVNTSPNSFSNSVSVGSFTFPSLVSPMKEAFEGDNANGNKFLRLRCQHDLTRF